MAAAIKNNLLELSFVIVISVNPLAARCGLSPPDGTLLTTCQEYLIVDCYETGFGRWYRGLTASHLAIVGSDFWAVCKLLIVEAPT